VISNDVARALILVALCSGSCASSSRPILSAESADGLATVAAIAESLTMLVVGESAVIVRGKLPPVHEGLPEHLNGLMVGLPGGLSFEYDADDGRLLAVRRGAFVELNKSNERAGEALKPLGEIIFEVSRGDPDAWHASGRLRYGDLVLQLDSTTSVGGEARIEWKTENAAWWGVERVVEVLFQPNLSEPNTFGRRITIERAPDALALWIPIAGETPEHIQQEEPRQFRLITKDKPLAGEPWNELWTVLAGYGGINCVNLRYQGRPGLMQGDADEDFLYGSLGLSIDGCEGMGRSTTTFTMVVVHGKPSSEMLSDHLEHLSRELSQ